MKALVYTQPHELVFRDEPGPAAASGEVLVRLDSIGICGSDMHGYHGHDPRRVPPLILGHEAAGVVVAGELEGRRVAVNPLITCGRCDDCVSGRANLCPERQLIGMARPGAFAELVAIPDRNLIPVPEGMELAHAALMEPAGVAVHAVHLAERASVRPLSEAKALVIGAGPIGLLCALVLRNQGCRKVLLADTNPLRRETAARTGSAEVFDPGSGKGPDEGSCEVVIDAVGGEATRAAAIRAVRPGGVIVHVGLMQDSGAFDVRKITLQEVSFVGCYTYNELDLRRALRLLHEGALGPLDWIETCPLAEGAHAFAALDRGEVAAAKVVLQP
jgi:2-desacetyl-2-hydroxyethyl bacteriochlorophyllide A dehydrogenase